MKFLVVSVAALLSTAASAETHQYRVLFGGDDVGGLEVETAGNTSNIEFDYKQNGRGPTIAEKVGVCLLYTSPSPRDRQKSRMPSSA